MSIKGAQQRLWRRHENTAFALWADETDPLTFSERECADPDRLFYVWVRASYDERRLYRAAADLLLDLPEFGPGASPR